MVGSDNAAVLVGFAGIYTTSYFLLRAWSDWLVANYESERDRNAQNPTKQTLGPALGDRLERNLRAQGRLNGFIHIVDFWLPIVLAVLVAIVLYADTVGLATSVVQKLISR